MPNEQDDLKAMQKRLVDTRCICQRQKRAREPFCRQCFLALAADETRTDRSLLSGLLSEVMVEAWKRCLEFLVAQGYVREGARL
jgi:hypothetical protein